MLIFYSLVFMTTAVQGWALPAKKSQKLLRTAFLIYRYFLTQRKNKYKSRIF